MRESEENGNLTGRLALMEECKSLPWGAVWDAYCESKNVPPNTAWLKKICDYEKAVLSKRA
jgi:L-rhamnose isomerase